MQHQRDTADGLYIACHIISLMKGKSRMPLAIMLMGVVFNVLNGLMQGEWLFYLAPEGLYTDCPLYTSCPSAFRLKNWVRESFSQTGVLPVLRELVFLKDIFRLKHFTMHILEPECRRAGRLRNG